MNDKYELDWFFRETVEGKITIVGGTILLKKLLIETGASYTDWRKRDALSGAASRFVYYSLVY